MKKYIVFLALLQTLSSSAQLTISPGTFVTLSQNTTLSVSDIDVVVDGSLVSDAGSSLHLAGTSPTKLTGSSPLTLSTLVVEKTPGQSIALEQDVTILSAIHFSSGLLDLKGQIVTLQPEAELIDESPQSHAIGTSGGHIEITAALTAPVGVNPGNLGATITSELDLGQTTLRRGHQAQASGAFSSINRYFDILPENNSNLNATLRFAYLDSELNGIDKNMLKLSRSTDLLNWINQSGGTVHNTSENYLEKEGVSQFSRWTAFVDEALPVTLAYFNATLLDSGHGQLQWATTAETNFSHFDVQRSTDGRQFESLGRVTQGVAHATETTYRFTDHHHPVGLHYYRLQMVDLDGSYQYAPIVTIRYPGFSAVSVYPNPVRSDLHLTAGRPIHTVEIYNALGTLLGDVTGKALKSVPMSSYPAGLYLVRLNGEHLIRVVKE